jgi:hypothetical protein
MAVVAVTAVAVAVLVVDVAATAVEAVVAATIVAGNSLPTDIVKSREGSREVAFFVFSKYSYVMFGPE